MRKIIQCVQNDNKNVKVEETIKAIKKAGFDSVFLIKNNLLLVLGISVLHRESPIKS